MVFLISSHILPHGTVVLGGTILHYIGTIGMYGTTQMQLHTCARVLVCQHACVNMLPITCDGVLRSLTCYTHVLHEGLHTHMCYSSRYKLATRMNVLLMCTTWPVPMVQLVWPWPHNF